MARLIENTMAAFLSHAFHLQDATLQMSTKVGVAMFPDDGTDAETLFKNDEGALNTAKASPERYLFYTLKMTTTAAAKLSLENRLHQALEREEFELHYQPKVSLPTGKVTSAEA